MGMENALILMDQLIKESLAMVRSQEKEYMVLLMLMNSLIKEDLLIKDPMEKEKRI
jgi:hypothetical protein